MEVWPWLPLLAGRGHVSRLVEKGKKALQDIPQTGSGVSNGHEAFAMHSGRTSARTEYADSGGNLLLGTPRARLGQGM